MTNKFDELSILANEALKHRKAGNAEAFNESIQKIVNLDDGQLYKSDLINLIAYDKYREDDTWIDDFILYDLKYSDGYSAGGLLVMFLMIGTNKPEETYMKELVARMSIMIEIQDYYDLRANILHSPIPEKLIPITYKIEERESIKEAEYYGPGDFYVLSDKDEVIVNRSDKLVRETEVADDDENVWTDECYHEDVIYGDAWGEEFMYRKCFDENEQPIVEELENIKQQSSKAWHKLLELEGKEYGAWFEEEEWETIIIS